MKESIKKEISKLKAYSLAAVLLIPMCAFAQGGVKEKASDRVEVSYKQRHSKLNKKDLYADGIKIKRDLSLIDKVQEERILDADEVPADEIYGGVWNNRYINVYGSVENAPDTFKINLANFSMPTMGYTTSNFGHRGRRMHYGIDLKVQVGDTIYAAFDGKVRICQYERRGYGYYVALRHSNGLETVYGHLSKFLVKEDDVVKSGDPIALGGNTGRSTGAHLHFETRFLGKPINPIEIIDFDNKVTHRDTYKVTPRSFAYSGNAKSLSNASTMAASKNVKTAGANKYVSGSVKYHRVKKGDTLSSIARRYSTTVKKLCSINSLTEKSKLNLGKSIRIP